MASCGMTTSGRPPVHQTKGERLAWEMTTRGSRWIPNLVSHLAHQFRQGLGRR